MSRGEPWHAVRGVVWRKHLELSSALHQPVVCGASGSRNRLGVKRLHGASMDVCVGSGPGVRAHAVRRELGRSTAVGGRAQSRQAWIVVEESFETCLNCLFSFGPLSLLAEAWESEITRNGEPGSRRGFGQR